MDAGYIGTLESVLSTDKDRVLGELARVAAASGHAQHWHAQTVAWAAELDVLRATATRILRTVPSAGGWPVILEYEIPRRGRRIDLVILVTGTIAVVEFKVGSTTFEADALWQVEEYALDLHDFHEASRGHPIVPVLVPTGADSSPGGVGARPPTSRYGLVGPVQRIRPADLPDLLIRTQALAAEGGRVQLNGEDWAKSAYRPTPQIVEAAIAIFAGHHVREISHAAAADLSRTTILIGEAIRRARSEHRRTICFVTGVPGAGKTLAGLCTVHGPGLNLDGAPLAVFLSGNGPLVKVVRAALARDLARRGQNIREGSRQVETFVQNVHQFLRQHTAVDSAQPPPENVVVFDEAQRAWSSAQMQRKRGVEGSEPELLLDVMERCPDWCAVVCLVGGGQEIHNGEAGLSEWGRALLKRTEKWSVVASAEAMTGGPSVAGRSLFENIPEDLFVQREPALHLGTSVRSLRSRTVADWVNAVLTGNAEEARTLLTGQGEFPIRLTRNLGAAREWLTRRAGERQPGGIAGLVASSGASRLRAFGVEVSAGFRRSFPFEEWFLAAPRDVRGSSWLEVAATEFEIQGLELDWVGLCWGDDLTMDLSSNTWEPRKFIGSRWTSVRQPVAREYALNKYRVLLTRARRGMVVWVPTGVDGDQTRSPARLDATAGFLHRCGIPMLEGQA